VKYLKGRAVPVEVHWNLAFPREPVRVDLEGIWQRAVSVSFGESAALIMAPEDLVLHLCMHAAGHHKLQRSLRGLCDVSLAVQSYGKHLDWPAIERRAREWQIDRYVYLMLRLARELLDSTVPESTLSALEPEHFQPRLLPWAAQALLERYRTPPVTSTFVRFWSGRSLSEKAQALAGSLSLDAAAHRFSLGRGSRDAYLRYPLRIVDLVSHYVPVAVRLCAGDRRSREMFDRERGLLSVDDWLSS
jgi:hypothetical protein